MKIDEEQSKIIRLNVMIHDWMGANRMNPPFQHWYKGALKPEDLRYHRSFDWLIPVYNRIKLLYHQSEELRKRLDENDWSFYRALLPTVLQSSDVTKQVEIMSAFLKLSDFLTWYTNQLWFSPENTQRNENIQVHGDRA